MSEHGSEHGHGDHGHGDGHGHGEGGAEIFGDVKNFFEETLSPQALVNGGVEMAEEVGYGKPLAEGFLLGPMEEITQGAATFGGLQGHGHGGHGHGHGGGHGKGHGHGKKKAAHGGGH